MVVKYTRQALLYFGAGNESDQSMEPSLLHQLAYALTMQKDMKSASDYTVSCLGGAEKLGVQTLLQILHTRPISHS